MYLGVSIRIIYRYQKTLFLAKSIKILDYNYNCMLLHLGLESRILKRRTCNKIRFLGNYIVIANTYDYKLVEGTQKAVWREGKGTQVSYIVILPL